MFLKGYRLLTTSDQDGYPLTGLVCFTWLATFFSLIELTKLAFGDESDGFWAGNEFARVGVYQPHADLY